MGSRMSFRLLPKSVTLGDLGVMALILRYFTEFIYDVVVKQLLGLPRFQTLRIGYNTVWSGICEFSRRYRPPLAQRTVLEPDSLSLS